MRSDTGSELKSWRWPFRKPGKLARGAAAMTFGLGLRTLGQAMVFLIIARVLGVEEYGAYSAVLALALALGWFAGLGVPSIMLRDTARNPDTFTENWSHTLGALLLTAPILLLLYLAVARVVLPQQIGWTVITCIGLADILLAPLAHAAMQAYQSHERMGRAGRILLAPILPRMGMALLLLALTRVSPSFANLTTWSLGYLIATVASTTYALKLLGNDFNIAHIIHWQKAGSAIREGWPYALGVASGKIYVDIDKLMLASLAGLDIAGGYAAAYRFVDVGSIPLAALLGASLPRILRAGQNGVPALGRYIFRILPLPFCYAAALGTIFFTLSGVLPWLLGTQYEDAVDALRWLAWLPLIKLPRSFAQHALIAADRKMHYAYILTSGALMNITLNLWAIPNWSWNGAIASTYITELAMFSMQLMVLFFARKQQL